MFEYMYQYMFNRGSILKVTGQDSGDFYARASHTARYDPRVTQLRVPVYFCAFYRYSCIEYRYRYRYTCTVPS